MNLEYHVFSTSKIMFSRLLEDFLRAGIAGSWYPLSSVTTVINPCNLLCDSLIHVFCLFMNSFLEKNKLVSSNRFLSFCFKKDPVFRCRHFQPARMDPQELRISFAHRSKLSPFDPSVAWLSTKKKYKVTLYGTTVSHHLWKTKIIFNIDFSGDMLVPRRVLVINGVMGKWPKIIGFH